MKNIGNLFVARLAEAMAQRIVDMIVQRLAEELVQALATPTIHPIDKVLAEQNAVKLFVNQN